MTFIGGDVHVGGHSEISRDGVVIFQQFITSAIANYRLSKFEFFMGNAITDTAPLTTPAHSCARLAALFLTPLPYPPTVLSSSRPWPPFAESPPTTATHALSQHWLCPLALPPHVNCSYLSLLLCCCVGQISQDLVTSLEEGWGFKHRGSPQHAHHPAVASTSAHPLTPLSLQLLSRCPLRVSVGSLGRGITG